MAAERVWPGSRGHTLLLGAADLVLILLVFAVGLMSHGVSPLEQPIHTISIASPFLFGWILLAPIFGVYERLSERTFANVAGATLLAWSRAAVFGSAVRATEFVHGGAPPVFVAVTIATGAAILVPWRIMIALLVRRVSAHGSPNTR